MRLEPLFKIVEDLESGLFYMEFETEFNDVVERRRKTYTLPITKELGEDLIRYFEGAEDMVDAEDKEDVEYQKEVIKGFLVRLRKFLE